MKNNEDNNPFLKPGTNPTRGFTKYLKSMCDTLLINQSDCVVMEGLENKSIKSLLSTHYKGQFITRQHLGKTWIKRIGDKL